MAGGLAGALAQTGRVQPAPAAGAFAAEPPQHGHGGLLARRDGQGHAVQVQALFAQRFAVVRRIHQAHVIDRLLLLQVVDGLAQQVVGVEDGVVVGIDDLLPAALAQLVLHALGREAPELGRVALVVSRAVVAQLVQQHHGVTRRRGGGLAHHIGQSLQQHAVEAAAAGAQAGVAAGGEVAAVDAVAQALAAALVVQPHHPQAGTRQQLRQGFAAADQVFVVVGPSLGREHAGQ